MHGLPLIQAPLSGVTRREFLVVSAATLGLLLTGCLNHSVKEQPLTFGEMAMKLDGMARSLVGSAHPDEEAYLQAVEQLVGRLGSPTPPDFQGRSPVTSCSGINGNPLKIVYFKLQPGARIPPHDHRDYNGVVHVMEGSARILSYDIAGKRPADSSEPLLVRKTREVSAFKGDNSTLTRSRDNIHDIVAGPEGVVFMDVFTFFSEDGHSTYLTIEDKKPGADGLYRARWS
ncbi:MAG: hypothetical protein AB7F75_10385 [Planctomycetota bacterium]